MRQSIVTNGLMLVTLLLAGPLAYLLMSGIKDPTGGHGSTILLSANPGAAAARALGAVLLAGAIGAISARLVTLRWGLWNAGVVLAWSGAGLGNVVEIIHARGSATGLMGAFAIEGGVLVLLAAGIAFLAGRLRADRHADQHEELSAGKRAGMIIGATAAALVGVAVGTRIGMINNLKGQAVFSVLAGSAIGAVLASLVMPRISAWPIVCAVAIVAVAGPLYAASTVPASQFVEQIFGATLIGFGRITPMDWAAGSLMGTPLGLWIASGIIDRAEHAHAARA